MRNQHGPVPDADSEAIVNVLDEYITAGGQLDFGEYNTLERARAVVAADLLKQKTLLGMLFGPIPSGRFLSKQMQACLQTLIIRKGRHVIFPAAATRSTEHLARAVTTSLSVQFAHVRRLRNDKLFQQATVHLPHDTTRELKGLVSMLETTGSQTSSPAKSDSSLASLVSDAQESSKACPVSSAASVRQKACPASNAAGVRLDADGWPVSESDSDPPASAGEMSESDSDTTHRDRFLNGDIPTGHDLDFEMDMFSLT